jgi:adenylyltransferase/sulfurtransferase
MELLTDLEKAQYHRQMLIAGWGEEGQQKLKRCRVFIAGAGGLGSPVSIYLAVAGIGEISICDADTVELSNLNRQILHPIAHIGQPKVVSAERTLQALNPSVRLLTHAAYMDQDSLAGIVGRPDVVVDCLDNFDTRYLLNAYCVQRGIPLVHGAIHGMMGQVTFLQPPETPCLRCLFPSAPPKETFPVVGATPGIVGCIQALEVLKHLTGVGSTLKGRLLFFDGEEMAFSVFNVSRTPDCPECGRLSERLRRERSAERR